MIVRLVGATRSKSSGAGDMTLKLKIGSTIAATFISATMTDNTEGRWFSELKLVAEAVGESGRLYVLGESYYNVPVAKHYVMTWDDFDDSLAVSMDTTAEATLSVTCTFSVADSANECDLYWMNVNRLSTTAS
jgi:hypothetical protein